MSAVYGGAIAIEEEDSNKDTTVSATKYLISKSTFFNSSANVGGAIYMDNPQYVSISNCTFKSNKAYNLTSTSSTTFDYSGSGGAIYY